MCGADLIGADLEGRACVQAASRLHWVRVWVAVEPFGPVPQVEHRGHRLPDRVGSAVERLLEKGEHARIAKVEGHGVLVNLFVELLELFTGCPRVDGVRVLPGDIKSWTAGLATQPRTVAVSDSRSEIRAHYTTQRRENHYPDERCHPARHSSQAGQRHCSSGRR